MAISFRVGGYSACRAVPLTGLGCQQKFSFEIQLYFTKVAFHQKIYGIYAILIISSLKQFVNSLLDSPQGFFFAQYLGDFKGAGRGLLAR